LQDSNSAKIKQLMQENSDLKSTVESHNDTTPTDQVKVKYDKCIKKLKIYREKICEIYEKFKLLKADSEILVSTTRYSDCVTKWQKDIANASIKMITKIKDSEKKLSALEEEVEALKTELEALKSSKVADNEDVIKNLEGEIQKLKEVVKSKDRLDEEREAQRKLRQAVKQGWQ
jgi:DNA repair exonuclease SbcCD ATPase subunit